MRDPGIRTLFKYMEATQRVLDIITSGEIWYSRPEQFNDPFDCDIDITSAVSWDEYVGAIRHEGKSKGKSEGEIRAMIRTEEERLRGTVPGEYVKQVKAGAGMVKQLLRSQGILSLSAIPDSIPMWSYYAGAHSGVCIGFRREPENPLGSSATNPVTYTDRYPAVSYYDLFEKPGFLTDIVMQTKSSVWQHEQEWRVILSRGDMMHEGPGLIEFLIFGIRTTDKFKRDIKIAAASVDGVELFQAQKAPGEFRLDLVTQIGVRRLFNAGRAREPSGV